MSTNGPQRDLVVVGASAGGVDALPRVLTQLPTDLPAAVMIVQHQMESSSGYLLEILRRSAAMPVAWAEQGERIERGKVYVAPPGSHLALSDGHVRLAAGARVNYARPSIDVLFRSAAVTHGSRTIGVLLSGMMADGVAGLDAIHRAGGRVLVQDPDEAAFPDLPRAAIDAVPADKIVRIAELGHTLIQLTAEHAPRIEVPTDVALETQIDVDAARARTHLDRIGRRSSVVCPECDGPMWEIASPTLTSFRCYLGHVVNASELLERKGQAVEQALWSAVRSLHERARTLEALSEDSRRRGNLRTANDYQRHAVEELERANLARDFMLELIRKLS